MRQLLYSAQFWGEWFFLLLAISLSAGSRSEASTTTSRMAVYIDHDEINP